MSRLLLIFGLASCIAGGGDKPADTASTNNTNYERGGNIIVLFMDDVGLDKIAAYGAHPNPANTPVIDRMAEEGLLFMNAYSNPTCTPSRSALLTGRHASRTGLGRWMYAPSATFDLQEHEHTIAEYLRDGPYSYQSAVAGKWHLGSFLRDDPGLHPLQQGFVGHAGSMSNPTEAVTSGPMPRTYYNWEKNTNGSLNWVETYMTTDAVNSAILAMESMSPPWFVYVPFNAPHEPVHHPPEDLLAEPLPDDASELQQFNAMIEAMDTEIGRLLENIPDDQRDSTTVFVIGDNGTPSFGIEEPWPSNRSKGSVWESGVHVPMVAWGQHVTQPGTRTEALVHLVDVFATMADIGDANLAHATFTEGPWSGTEVTIDGESFLPTLHGDEPETWKEFLYTEGFYPNGAPPYDYHKRMVRDSDWKFYRNWNGEAYEEGLYRYTDEFWTEGEDNLLLAPLSAEAEAAHSRLLAEMERWQTEITYGP
jgi:arylsulfatase A-like enzyme